jgi:hypothetical protein
LPFQCSEEYPKVEDNSTTTTEYLRDSATLP